MNREANRRVSSKSINGKKGPGRRITGRDGRVRWVYPAA